jgi:hypothetical protein
MFEINSFKILNKYYKNNLYTLLIFVEDYFGDHVYGIYMPHYLY